MANYSLSIYLALFSLILSIFFRNLVHASKPQDSTDDADWINTKATWYGAPRGAGGPGICENDFEALQWEPYNSLTAAVAYPLFENNLSPNNSGCRACYQIRCFPSQNCSGNPVVVTATDYLQSAERGHLFDLSECSIVALANPGKADQILKSGVGLLDVQYKRCKLVDVDVTFTVGLDSTETYFETSVECGNGDEIAEIEVSQQRNLSEWVGMAAVGGSSFSVGFNETYTMPLSFKMKTNNSHIVVVKDAIPTNYTRDLPYVLKTVWSPVSSAVSLAACIRDEF